MATAKTTLPQIPAALADVALLDAPTAAAVGGARTTWWYERVAAGEAPPPVIRQTRFTRWRASDVARFWSEFATRGTDERVIARAAAASAAAKAKRRQSEPGA